MTDRRMVLTDSAELKTSATSGSRTMATETLLKLGGEPVRFRPRVVEIILLPDLVGTLRPEGPEIAIVITAR